MSKTVRYLLSGCVALILLLGAFSAGIVVGWFLPRQQAVSVLPAPELAPTQDEKPQTVLPSATPQIQEGAQEQNDSQNQDDAQALFAPFWEVWDLVKQIYVEQPVDEEQMMRGAIRGMLEALGDEHTSYMDPEQYRQASMEMEGDYEGIGAWVDTTGEYVKIISPMPGSPAEKAGLKTGDVIIAVDQEDMSNIDGSLVLRRILGPAGTDVTLTIRRDGQDEPFDVTITRATIIIPSVESKMLDNNIAYIHILSFAEDTNTDLEKALTELLAKNPKGVVLDLRNNPGGYLKTAIEVVSQFIPQGVVMYEEYGDGTRKPFEALSNGLATDIPLVVLVNEGSASASEITAGAIQDLGRAKLVGVTTYGKGSVQTWTPLNNDQGAVRITIAHWLTPNGRQIHKIGLEPDVKVEITEEDTKEERDPQLDKAIEVLLQEN